MDKKKSRLRRANRTRIKFKLLKKTHLSVHKTSKHIYAQIISDNGCSTLVSASTLEADIKKECSYTGNITAAKVVGKFLAKKAISKGIKQLSFDRSGFKYHGRIKALASSAREHGLDF